MKTAIVLASILSVVVFGFSIYKLKGIKLNAKVLSHVGLVSAMTIVLYAIKLVPFPQGGGCSLMSILPIMVLSIVFGLQEALLAAIVVGLLKIIVQPPMFIAQLPLDYFGGMIAIAFTTIFGNDSRKKILAGAIFASLLSAFFSILSGFIFFGQFAPKDMNKLWYSIVYNFTGFGVEAVASIVVLMIICTKHLDKFKYIKE